MNKAGTIFRITAEGRAFDVKKVRGPGKAVLYIITASGFQSLCVHKALAQSEKKFWTSIPEGRQHEAERFGPLIDKVLHQEEVPSFNFQATGQYMQNPDNIDAGKQCPYCGQATIYTDSTEIYGSSYGMVYLCRPCQAWVGVHRGTDIALGRVATKEHRALRRQGHVWFDTIASALGKEPAYQWLAEKMGIPREACHFALFDQLQCERAIEICRPVAEDYLQAN